MTTPPEDDGITLYIRTGVTAGEQPVPAVQAAVAAEPGSRLEQLLAAYESAKAAADEAAARFRAITDAIKADLAHEHPGAGTIMLSGAPGLPRLRMAWRNSWRLDSKRLKDEDPVTYVRYATQSGTWELRQSS